MKFVNEMLYKKVKTKGVDIKCAAEIGVSKPEKSNIHGFINDGVKSILIEANPETCYEIESYFKDKNNVVVYANAISEEKGKINLILAGSSSFISSVDYSPAMVNDSKKASEEQSIEVDSIPLFELDEGDIDLISIDVEGAEWYVIKTMKSRPKVVSVETHGGIYRNPKISEISHWMSENGYQVWYYDKSDTVYIKENIHISMPEKIYKTASKAKVNIKYLRKKVSRRLKNK